MKKKQERMNRLWWMASAVVLLFVALAVVPVAASINPWTYGNGNNKTFVNITNTPPRFAYQSPYDGYYVNLTNTTGGMNAIHITNYPTDVDCQPGWYYNGSCFSGIYADQGTSGTFYVSDTGGKGGEDDIILLVAINSTSQSDLDTFNITLTAKGYQWDPVPSGSSNNIPSWSNFQTKTQQTPLNAVTFTAMNYSKDLSGTQISQDWKFGPMAGYPIYNGQTMSVDPSFKLMVIDLKAGVVGNQTKKSGGSGFDHTYYQNLTDLGMVNIAYSISPDLLDSSTRVAFNVYAYNNQTMQGQGVNWLNRVYKSGDGTLIQTNSSGWRIGLV